MLLLHAPDELPAGRRGVCLAIGVFDGVHLGHQQIIRQTVADARRREAIALVITFDRHPNAVVAPERVPPLIQALSQKLRAIEALDADALLLVRFDEAFSRQPGEAFIRGLADSFGSLRSICVGADFSFGHKRSGDVALLRRLGEELHFAVHGLAAVSLDGEPVSSTRIREAIRAGELDRAGQMLGRPYALAGHVVRGDQLGKRLGFPTANLDVAGLVLPPNGVYSARAIARGRRCRAVVNIGFRPTLQRPAPTLQVEAHLLDFDGNLYGEELEIEFSERLRDEKRFASTEELKQQITRDIAEARSRFPFG
jgi:riboflavin kinase/FMN adenylyltransferase